MGLRAYQHGAGHRLTLQPGCGVDRVPERRVLHAAPAADRAGHDRAGLDPHADIHLGDTPGPLDLLPERSDLFDDPQTRTNGSFRIVLVRGRSPEDRQHAVAREVLHVAVERLDRDHHAGDRLAHHELEFLGVQPFTERRRADQVGEDRGDDPTFLAHAHRCILRQGPASDNLRPGASISPPVATRRARTAPPRALACATTRDSSRRPPRR